jgi:hypothetical protein
MRIAAAPAFRRTISVTGRPAAPSSSSLHFRLIMVEVLVLRGEELRIEQYMRRDPLADYGGDKKQHEEGCRGVWRPESAGSARRKVQYCCVQVPRREKGIYVSSASPARRHGRQRVAASGDVAVLHNWRGYFFFFVRLSVRNCESTVLSKKTE